MKINLVIKADISCLLLIEFLCEVMLLYTNIDLKLQNKIHGPIFKKI